MAAGNPAGALAEGAIGDTYAAGGGWVLVGGADGNADGGASGVVCPSGTEVGSGANVGDPSWTTSTSTVFTASTTVEAGF